MEIPKELYNEALDIARLILSEDAKEKIKGYELDADYNTFGIIIRNKILKNVNLIVDILFCL